MSKAKETKVTLTENEAGYLKDLLKEQIGQLSEVVFDMELKEDSDAYEYDALQIFKAIYKKLK